MEITRTSATTLNPATDPRLVPQKPAGDASPNTKTATQSDTSGTGQSVDTEKASPIKAFSYGALDLEKPGQKSEETDQAYSAGKWAGAAAKVGAIVSLLI